jgi:hypothetical protein
MRDSSSAPYFHVALEAMTCEVIDMMRSMGNGGPMTATTTRPTTRSTLLERALGGNVVFSLVSGAALLVGSTWLADVIGPPAWALALVGAGVIGFGISIARGMQDHLLATGKLAMIADLAWVAATVGLAPFVADSFSWVGGWVAVGVAVMVADFALLEWFGLRRVHS